MNNLKFRTRFSLRLRTGKRAKLLNSRTKKSEKCNPVLIIDLTYIENLLNSKKQYKNSSLYNKDTDALIQRMYEWLSSAFNLTTPQGILFTAEKETEFLKLLDKDIMYGNIKNIIFSIITQQSISKPLCILSDNLELWSLSAPSTNLSFLAIDSNNRMIYYNNKTGLDILSKFIGTYKIVNKLGLDSLKYVSLQYLYILLFYIQFTNNKPDTDFYFDNDFFKQFTNKQFSKSNGYGLELITAAHKFLSYAFLTKPEFMDYFLIGEISHYSLNLQRLVKLMYFDVQILDAMKRAYHTKSCPVFISNLTIPSINPILPANFTYYPEKITKIDIEVPKTADTISDIESYVTNLLGL